MAGDVTVAVVSGALNTGASATTDFTKAGFGTPKAAIITLTYDASDDANSATEYKVCIGITDFTNSRYITVQSEDAADNEDCDGRKGKNDTYFLHTVAAGDDGRGDATTITDGVRLTNQSAFSRAVFVEITMFCAASEPTPVKRAFVINISSEPAAPTAISYNRRPVAKVSFPVI